MKNEKAQRIAARKQRQRLASLGMIGLGVLLLLGLAVVFIKNNLPEPKPKVEVSGAPSLKVDKESIDLGNEKLGSTVSASFKLTNVGDQPLKLTEQPYVEVKEGC